MLRLGGLQIGFAEVAEQSNSKNEYIYSKNAHSRRSYLDMSRLIGAYSLWVGINESHTSAPHGPMESTSRDRKIGIIRPLKEA